MSSELAKQTVRLDYLFGIFTVPEADLKVDLFVVELGTRIRGVIKNQNGKGLFLVTGDGSVIPGSYRVGDIRFI